MQAIGIGRPIRQDTFDLRDQIQSDDNSHIHSHVDNNITYGGTSDEEHSVLEDDSDAEDREVDYMDEDDDGSSILSIPNESIDFDLVYSLHSFAATVEGQANVVKGDSLFLMDDSNSYWWLVRVLKTQEVGYIPAENIETPFERLARLNKHRNVDLASATQAELQEDVHASRDRLRNNLVSSRNGQSTPSPIPGKSGGPRPGQSRGVLFTPALSVHRYPPAVWGEEEEEDPDVEWDDDPYIDEDPELADELHHRQMQADNGGSGMSMEPDDGMSWDDGVAEGIQARALQVQNVPSAPQVGLRIDQQQQSLQAQQQYTGAQQASIQPQSQEPTQTLRHQTSRERLLAMQDGVKPSSPGSPGAKSIDPAEVTETRKLTVTPTIARDRDHPSTATTQPNASAPLLPSVIMQKQDEDRRRMREDIEALEEESRKRVKLSKEKDKPAPIAAATAQKSNGSPTGTKLRKDPQAEEENTKEKKKKGGLFSGLFGSNKKDKKDKSSSATSADGGSVDFGRTSSESGRSSNQHSIVAADPAISPVTATALQQQGLASSMRNSAEPKRLTQQQQPQQQQPQQQQHQQHQSQQQQQRPQPQPSQTSSQPPQISQHASQLRQRDQQQQALYKQYLTHSPSSPPEASPNYGLQTLSAVMPGSSSFNSSTGSGAGLGLPSSRPRPGSLVLSPADGQGVPDLSVIRVFAGRNVQTEATFKTVLLNTSTTSSDLVRQAIQRFRLPAGEDAKDYYLTVKQVEGSSAVLLPGEHPLGVFETLVEAAMELPKVKRSSVGSISSVASNLSMHPAIKKLSMNDFTDDSAVKFYLNRKGDDSVDGNSMGDDGDETLMADMSHDSDGSRSQQLGAGSNLNNVTSDRFSSPSFRFALQLVIYPDDLPDDMVFDPLTEAIVFKHTLRDRSQSSISSSPGISHSMRRKVFMFPKNVTVAEVIELGLERFGILEGVVDGGDEIEDKLTKRRSSVRVRYGLTVDNGVQERELSPSSKVIDAYPRPPTYRAAERRPGDSKRRSVDSAQLLGSLDDVNPEDPIFVLRRAISYRSSSRHRLSAPLDEIALSHLHRESASGSSISSDTGAADEVKSKQLSRQELIAAQRAASRANQKSILSAQTNSVRGVDVLLPGNAMIRSSRYDSGDKMRYSYVEPDGETYDISDIVEEEWQEKDAVTKNDLLQGVLVRSKDGLGDNFDRVLNKIKDGKASGRVPTSQLKSNSQLDRPRPTRSTSPSELSNDQDEMGYVDNLNSRSSTPIAAATFARTPTPTSATIGNIQRVPTPSSGSVTPVGQDSRNLRPRTNTPTTSSKAPARRNPSIASVMSDISGYGTPASHMHSESPDGSTRSAVTPKPQRKRPYIPKDDFGLSHMMTIIELAGSTNRAPVPPMDPVDELLFGRELDIESLHPQVKNIFSNSFKQLNAMDKNLDEFLQRIICTS